MKRRIYFFFEVLLFAVLLLPTRSRAADNSVNFGNDRLDARAAGITGGILVGAETVIIVEAVVGVDKLWPYLVFPALGAAGGGAGGYFLQKASTPGAVALLVTGIAMIVPSAVLTASAFFYDPEKDGAVQANSMERGAYSFEMPPMEGVQKETEAVIDVERSFEAGPPEDAAPSEYEEAPPSEVDDKKSAPEEDESAAVSSAREKNASRARAASGTLLYVSSAGKFSMSVPLIDVRPARRTDRVLRADGALERKGGVELYIALLRVDLP